MAVYEIPLDPINQRFQITIGGIEYGFRVLWNTPMQCWVLDIYDFTDVPILTGVPLITGADLLAQYLYLHIGNNLQEGSASIDGQMVVITTAVGVSPDDVPTQTNLGTDGNLYWVI